MKENPIHKVGVSLRDELMDSNPLSLYNKIIIYEEFRRAPKVVKGSKRWKGHKHLQKLEKKHKKS